MNQTAVISSAFFHEGRPWIPWSIGFTEYFIEKRGYDPQEKLLTCFSMGKGRRRFVMIIGRQWRSVSKKVI